MTGSFTVDWQRRRLLPLDGPDTHCVHHSRLTEWCGPCQQELDHIAEDIHPDA